MKEKEIDLSNVTPVIPTEDKSKWEERTITFKHQISALVKLKPFLEKGATIIPPPHDRYRVEGRAYAEGLNPETRIIEASVIYYCLRVGTLDKKKVLTFPQESIEAWVDASKSTK